MSSPFSSVGELLEKPWRRNGECVVISYRHVTKLIDSPNPLVGNWIRERNRFFEPAVLVAKEWTIFDWLRNRRSLNTVWIVKESIVAQKHNFWESISSSEAR
jgi:hypothetical protein